MKKYAIISNKKRNELIVRVAQNGESVSRVAKQLRMKLPSAKSILRTYKKSGKIFDKKRIINRGIKTKKHDLSETDHHNSQELSKTDKIEGIIKVEPLENVQEEKKNSI